MKLWHTPYRWLPRTFWRNVSGIYYDIRNGVCNVFRWAPIIWFDRDWDWAYLAVILEHKFSRMSENLKNHGHCMSSTRHAKQLAVCAELVRRLQADEYQDNAEKRFGMNRAGVMAGLAQQKADQAYLGKLIGKYLTHWWD